MTERGRRRRCGLVAAVLLGVLASTGCIFTKSVTNERVRALDPARIRVGESTIFDVLRLLGAPPPRTTQELGTYALSGALANYRTVEQRCVVFGPQLYVILPFTWCYADDTYEIAIEYDGIVVSSLHVVERDMIWRPFQGEADLAPAKTRDLTRAYGRDAR